MKYSTLIAIIALLLCSSTIAAEYKLVRMANTGWIGNIIADFQSEITKLLNEGWKLGTLSCPARDMCYQAMFKEGNQ